MKPDFPNVEQVLELVYKLSKDDQEKLRKNLSNRSWGKRFQELCDRIEARRIAKGLPKISNQEIMAEVKAEREEMRARRAQSSH